MTYAQAAKPWDVAWGEVGYAQITSNVTSINAEADCISCTWTAVANRKYKVTAYWSSFNGSVAGDVYYACLKESTTYLQYNYMRSGATGNENGHMISVRLTGVSGGSHTYLLRAARGTGSGTGIMAANTTLPAFLLVEDIGPA